MNRSLILMGVLLIALGAVVLGIVTAGDRPEPTPLVGEAQGRLVDPPPRYFAAIAGLALAGGAACVGVGMNRWHQGRRRLA